MALLAIRPDERRDAWAAFFTLFGLIGSHTVLETARDALFLAKVPASQLPWVFLAVAGLSFVIARAQAIVSARISARPALAVFSLAAGGVTFAFFTVVERLGRSGLYALYVWSGLLTTLLLVHFWTLVGNLFSVTQAKRLYGFIGAGSVLGAIFGSGAASALTRWVPAQDLLLVSAIGFGATSALPFLFRDAGHAGTAKGRARTSFASNLGYIRESLYARRVVAMLLVSTITLTLADYLFKSMVARLVPAASLGRFLGTVYFALNVASLACQLFLVSRLLKRTSLGAALAILPVLLAFGGAAIAATGGIAAVLALKSADGSLRYSLHRTATELLFLPFSDEARPRVKGFMDVIGQRGGQIVASLALLAFAAMPGATLRMLAIGLVAIAAFWAVASLALREPYVELFRARLKIGRVIHLEEFPDLDLASLETLIAALDSRFDNEVLAALHVLEREEKVHLIPALILYHPSEVVVERALAIFTRARRTNVVHVIDRVLEHPSPRVRAATIAARSVLAPDAQQLLMRMSFEESAEVRATITVNLIASGEIYGSDATERIDALMKRGTPRTKIALAEAIAQRGVTGYDDVLVTLATAVEPTVRCAAVDAMGRLGRETFIPALIERLGEETTRPSAEKAIATFGDRALPGLVAALERPDAASTLRWRLPHAMALLSPHPAAAALLAWLPNERDGAVRFQIIRSLERLVRRTPDLPLDAKVLQQTIDQTVQRAFASLDSRLVLTRGAEGEPGRKTTGHDLLRTTLEHKEKNAVSRLFRLLGLAFPTEDFAQIHRQLRGTKDQRATSLELIDGILANPLRSAVRGLVDEISEDEWTLVARHYQFTRKKDYDDLLDSLKDNESEVVREVARFHLQELAA